MMYEYVVDVQGFQSPYNSYVFKELAVMSLVDNTQPKVYTFEPPHCWNLLPEEFKCENRWIERNYLGMAWSSGDIPHDKTMETVMNAVAGADRVYVKGNDKKMFIHNKVHLFTEVVDMETLGCPPLRQLSKMKIGPCDNHSLLPDRSVCAVQNVQILKDWLDNYFFQLSQKNNVSSIYN